MELWLVRHGRTAANEEGWLQGRLDVPLNEKGRREAALLGQRLGEAGRFDLFLSSDLERAWETAAIISRAIEQEPLGEPLLRECSWGFAEGLRRCELKAVYPFLFYPDGTRLRALRSGGEGERRLLARTRALRRKIERKHGAPRRALLVSHGRLLNAFIAGALGLSSRQRWPYAPAPASLSLLQYLPDRRFNLVLFNDTAHLEVCGSALREGRIRVE
ncbi:MAG: histidine phosphatase family protein [Firmicutes bacterium]|jgi:probable phosphoglycerate mutase|nr:histidine phosphatase family protein [Bacillota bacterium]